MRGGGGINKNYYSEKLNFERHSILLFILERAYLMLAAWSKQEGEAATKEEIMYVLEGLVASKAIAQANYEDIFE